MIRLNLQLFAKDLAYQRGYRKSKAIEKAKAEEKIRAEEKKTEQPKQEAPKKPASGEVVSRVNPREQYIVYAKDEKTGKLVPVAVRTGAQILEKMTYNPNREAWTSKAKGNKYIIRKKL